MPPKTKASPLATIRRQVAQRQRQTAVYQRNSAYTQYSQKNKEFIYGKKRSTRDDEDEDDGEDGGDDEYGYGKADSFIVKEPVRKKAKKAVPKKPRPPPAARSPTPEPVTECWRPAGGHESSNINDTPPSAVLAIARVSSWQVPDFIAALKSKIELWAEIEEVSEQILVHGGESLTNVTVKFASEEDAKMVKVEIDEELILGRKVQVKFSQVKEVESE